LKIDNNKKAEVLEKVVKKVVKKIVENIVLKSKHIYFI
jgi:hypothetical protein